MRVVRYLSILNSGFCRILSEYDCPDYDLGRQCEEEAGHILTECYKGCNEDDYCITKCFRDYDYHTYHCPCDGGCPDGCPCPVYDCPGYTTVKVDSSLFGRTCKNIEPCIKLQQLQQLNQQQLLQQPQKNPLHQ